MNTLADSLARLRTNMQQLQDRILAYITASNSLVSLEKLVLVAGKAGFSESEVLTAVTNLGKKLHATVRGAAVYYTLPKAPKAPYRPTLPPYPTSTYTELPFKVCSCALFHIHWHPSLGHFPQCDAITYTDEYAKQNPWDSTAGTMIDLVAYEKICNKEKAIRGRRTARHLPPS